MKEVLLLFGMILMHIEEDFCKQGILAQMKQKEWWKKNAPDRLYRNDYAISLVIHAIHWSVYITIPIIIWGYSYGLWDNVKFERFIALCVILNAAIHAIIDNLKCNMKMISLMTDQILHLFQILLTNILCVTIFMKG